VNVDGRELWKGWSNAQETRELAKVGGDFGVFLFGLKSCPLEWLLHGDNGIIIVVNAVLQAKGWHTRH